MTADGFALTSSKAASRQNRGATGQAAGQNSAGTSFSFQRHHVRAHREQGHVARRGDGREP